jgi:RND family efflux transporter MFP subunit
MRFAIPHCLGTGLGAALAVLAAGCQKSDASTDPSGKKADAPPIRVQTSPLVERTVPEWLVLTGTLKAGQESDVAADAAGKVIATFVERGQEVKAGEALASLDTRGASITASAAQAQASLTRAQLEQAQRECDRVKSLFDTGAISRAELDRTTSQCQTTKHALEAAEANQRAAAKALGDATIRAPFTGVIGERFVNVGQYVQPSARVVTLYAVDPLRLELTIPESAVAAVKPNAPVSFRVTSFAGETFSGSLRYISPNIRPQSRDLVAEAQVPNADRRLRPGMFATARLKVGERPLPVAPASAVKTDATTSRIYVVVANVVHERIVQIGQTEEGFVPILSGAKPGEVAIVDPGPDVKDGARTQ